jgi:Kef-type K+ transport system membrane component KefB
MLGMVTGQCFNLSSIKEWLSFITSICLAYIMIEVGLEFSLDKRSIKSYGWDALVATVAAVLPALMCFVYFLIVLQSSWKPALLSGLSSAPTSAGVLFSMMMAAGLSATWVFQKARTLAVLDDLVTILLLIPLQILIHGFQWETIVVVVFIFSFRWKNCLPWPTTQGWLILYSMVLTAILSVFQRTTHIHLEVLLPAFMTGCLLYLKKGHHAETIKASPWTLDVMIKGLFMFLVGASFPKVSIGSIPLEITLGHVAALTVLSNIGKSFTLLCYRKEVTLKERLALSVAMFPRGEVGAAVLLIGLGFGLGGYENTLAMLSLALNLVLTGVFVWIVIRLLRKA